jgi:hypothetical protein
MRSFLGWVLLVSILGGIAFVGAPIVARPIVVGVVQAGSPFGAGPLDVDVSMDAIGLVRGRIDRIHVTGTDLESERATIGRLDVTASGVSIVDRTFTSIEGSLDAVVVKRADGTVVSLDRVELAGPTAAVEATASIDRNAALELVEAALTDTGLPVAGVALVDGFVRLKVLGQSADIALGVVDGSVTMAGSLVGGSIVVFAPEPGDPWRITGVTVSKDGLLVYATVDVSGALVR